MVWSRSFDKPDDLARQFAKRLRFSSLSWNDLDRSIVSLPSTLDDQARAGLHRLLWSVNQDCDLTIFGRLALRWDLQRLMRNAIHVKAEAARARDTRIERPIFIIGLPRSGKTFLHKLMACDPDNLVPRVWQTIKPRPRPDDFVPRRSRSVRKVDRQLRIFGWLSAEFRKVHPMSADSPQECSEITAHVFESFRFETTFRVPAYVDWLDRQSHLNALRFHRKFLTTLQQGVRGRQWVLECPDHALMLDAIRTVYPDARFVMVHRDPLRFAASAAHVMEVTRRPFVRNVEPLEIGARTVAHWIKATAAMIELDRQIGGSPAQCLNVHFHDLMRDPIGTVGGIYTAFDMPLHDETVTAMRWLAGHADMGGNADSERYPADRYGIDLRRLSEQLHDYCRHFG